MEFSGNPITREEQYLAKIAGDDVKTPDHPVTRVEQYLQKIIDNGGGGGGGDEKVSIYQGEENAGKFLTVGTDGNVTLKSLDVWQGGGY